MVLDENGNAHLGNRMGPDVVTAGVHKDPTVFALKPHSMSKNTNNDSLKHSPQKKHQTRAEHNEKILKLCTDKLTASEESKAIVTAIKELYKTKVLPLEKKYLLHSLCLPTSGAIQDSEFDARPMVLLLGQYSTGKTTFIRHLLGVDFPGMHIGPEPTSDKFMALVHGQDHKIIKGNTLTVMPELPFFGLSQFGSRFLNHFNGSVTDSPLLQFMNMIDTPGILSGEKQRLSREYPFSKTAKWFADRSDLILLLFDAHKLDISDEFKEVVETIRPHNDDKIRCVLNKADSVEKDQLVRVYGSLMWSMGKLFSTPEVVRVYAGSFWDKPLLHNDFQGMFNADEEWLLDELMRLPSVSAERKVNAVVKRIRLVKVHLCILGYLRQQMPRFWGHGSVRQKLLSTLQEVFEKVQNQYGLSEGDMPNLQDFRERLASFPDFRNFPLLDPKDLDELESILTSSLPAIMSGASKNVATEEKMESTFDKSQRNDKVGTKSEQAPISSPTATSSTESIKPRPFKVCFGRSIEFLSVVISDRAIFLDFLDECCAGRRYPCIPNPCQRYLFCPARFRVQDLLQATSSRVVV